MFVQENNLDASQRFQKQILFQRFGREYFVLNISELKRVEGDSIYVSASVQKFNSKGNVGKPKKINNLAIKRSELHGVVISPPIQKIKKDERTLSWLGGTLAIVITTVILISN